MATSIPLPEMWYRRLLRATWFYDAINAFVAIPTATIAAWKLNAEGYGWGFFLIPAILFALAIVRLILAYRKDAGNDRINALEGALHTLHKVLLDFGPKEPEPRLRMTLHCPAGPDHLIQILDYVGDQRAKRTAGRKTRKVCGIIGAALETKRYAEGNRKNADAEAYVKILMKDWHYTEDEARKLNMSTMSWLAIPLTDANNGIVAILYADSVDAGFFTELRVLLALSAANGIAEFVSKRFT